MIPARRLKLCAGRPNCRSTVLRTGSAYPRVLNATQRMPSSSSACRAKTSYRIAIEKVRLPDHPEPTRPGNYRSSCEECPDGGHSFGLPCSSITRDLAPGGKLLARLEN